MRFIGRGGGLARIIAALRGPGALPLDAQGMLESAIAKNEEPLPSPANRLEFAADRNAAANHPKQPC